MSKTDSKTSKPHLSHNSSHQLLESLNIDHVVSQETQEQIKELTSEWAGDATEFIRKNPWAAVLGAAAIGYFLGATRNRGGR